jgi:hypothetical protein
VPEPDQADQRARTHANRDPAERAVRHAGAELSGPADARHGSDDAIGDEFIVPLAYRRTVDRSYFAPPAPLSVHRATRRDRAVRGRRGW